MRLVSGLALCVSLALLGATPAAAQTGNDLFQQALVKERVDGDVRGAIRIYERIVRDFARDRALVARALVQLGGCHERLGNQDAQRAYRRVVQEFADQTEMAREARSRLAALGTGAAAGARAAGGGVTIREIRFDGLENTPFAALSPDGSKMVYVHYRPTQTPQRYSLRVRTLASGEETILIDSVGQYAEFQWSPDGSQIAYGPATRELIVVGATGGTPRVAWSSPDAEAIVTPLDWSSDGDRVLVGVQNRQQWSVELVILALSGAAPRTLRSGRLGELEYGRFSPDGSLVAGVRRGDVVVWSVVGPDEVRVTNDEAQEEYPFWAPDGRSLLFISDRSGDKDVWAVPMRGGAPSGPAVRVRAGLGRRAMPTGLTGSGGLAFLTYGEGAPDDLYLLDVDPAAGAIARGFRPAARRATQHSQPRWSPDGTRFAYTSRKGEVRFPTIFVGQAAGGEDAELPMRDLFPAGLEWSRDGTSLIFPGWGRHDYRPGIFRLRLADNALDTLHLGDPAGPNFRGAFVNLVWMSGAGRYFFQQLASRSRMNFFTMEADGSGFRRTLDSVPTNSWAWPSPDGIHVAFRDQRSLRLIRLDNRVTRPLSEWADTTWFDVAPGWSRDGRQVAWTDRSALRVFETQGGTPRLVAEAPQGSHIVAPPAWAPGGTHIAYVVRDTTTGASSRLDEVWLVPSAGGAPRRIALAPETHPRLRLEAWLANGTLAAGGSQRRPEAATQYRHWLLEGFLPEAAAGARRR